MLDDTPQRRCGIKLCRSEAVPAAFVELVAVDPRSATASLLTVRVETCLEHYDALTAAVG